MSNRTNANEKQSIPNSRERNSPNQTEKRDSSRRFPFDHIYARQVDSAEAIPVRPEIAEEGAPSAAADNDLETAANDLPSNLITTPTYTPHSQSAEWRPERQEDNVEANYQQATVEVTGGSTEVKEESTVTISIHDEETLQLPPLRPTDEPIAATASSSADTDVATSAGNVVTICATNQSTSEPEQLDESIELPNQFITDDDNDLDTDKVKKLSERLLAVYARMKNSDNRGPQPVPLDFTTQYVLPPIPAVVGVEQLSQASALEPTAAVERPDNEVELFRRLGFNQGPNEVLDIHHLSHSFVLTNQFRQLRELLVYHLDLIQNLNETITSTTKLYQDLKEENDTLKNVIKRKALPGSPQFALSHAGSRHAATTSTITTTVTSGATSTLSSMLAPTRPHSTSETAVSHRDTATMRRLLATGRPDVARFSAAG
ncbi:PREDICTED: uncharacterized protein LOC106110267 [Papilio polytes]|uniref:uncharacterized protein LOC106110267 n=1 Tax=Papilio polytes TaxID=76194 RepID=UPI000676A123|nr:PREDICTED: uncharacterized protein LOC106110267 [Papilio polytes]